MSKYGDYVYLVILVLQQKNLIQLAKTTNYINSIQITPRNNPRQLFKEPFSKPVSYTLLTVYFSAIQNLKHTLEKVFTEKIHYEIEGNGTIIHPHVTEPQNGSGQKRSLDVIWFNPPCSSRSTQSRLQLLQLTPFTTGKPQTLKLHRSNYTETGSLFAFFCINIYFTSYVLALLIQIALITKYNSAFKRKYKQNLANNHY